MRRLMLFCTGFAGAVFLAQLILPAGWWPMAGGVCLVCGGLCAAFLRKAKRTRALLLAAGLVLGFLWSFVHYLSFYLPAAALDGQFTAVEGTILDYPDETAYGCSMTVLTDLPGMKRVRVRLYAGQDCLSLQPGDQISAMTETRLATVSGGEEVSFFTAGGIFLTAIAKGEVQVTPAEGFSPAALPAIWGRALQNIFRAVFPSSTRGLVIAIITGNLDEMETLRSALRRTGLYHAVSVSGMHVAFLAGLITLLAGGNKRRAAVLCIPIIIVFVIAVESPPPAVRAAVMYSIVLLAPPLRREVDMPTTLLFALFLLLAQNPYAAADVGLQLSFAAIAGMMLLSQPAQAAMAAKLPKFDKKTVPGKLAAAVCRFAVSALAATAGAMVFTVPLIALYFNMVSLVAPLASLVTLWAVSAAFLGGLTAGLLGLVWLPLGQGLAFLVSPVVHYLLWSIPLLAGLPLAAVTLRSVFYRGWLVLTYLLLGITFVPKGKKRPLVPACCIAAALLAAAVFTRLSYRTGPLTVTALDVGQGQCVVLLTNRYAAMVDCGGSQPGGAGDIAAAYLQDAGITALDVLVLTHYHADHANGVAELMRRVEVSRLLLPDVTPDDPLRQEILELAAAGGVRVVFADAPLRIELGSAALTVFPPLGGGDANEEGLSVLGTAGDFDVLVTGDMTSAVEAMLAARYALPDIELLVAGHHGSKYSTSAEFLAAVTPEYAFISVGYNTYGHPTPEVLTRLDDIGAAIYRTDWMGTVSFFVNTP